MRIFVNQALIVGAAFALLAACGGPQPTIAVPGTSSQTGASALANPLNVKGVYIGTWKATGGGKPSESGLFRIGIKRDGSDVSGGLTTKYGNNEYSSTYSGTVKMHGKSAKIHFTQVYFMLFGYGKGGMTVADSQVSGAVVFPPEGSAPAIKVTFAAKKVSRKP